jgi:hypothetical protein
MPGNSDHTGRVTCMAWLCERNATRARGGSLHSLHMPAYQTRLLLCSLQSLPATNLGTEQHRPSTPSCHYLLGLTRGVARVNGEGLPEHSMGYHCGPQNDGSEGSRCLDPQHTQPRMVLCKLWQSCLM